MYLREPGSARAPDALPPTTCLRGATGREATLALLARTGFAVRTWRDRSDALKALFASLIMAYGSAAAFWAEAAGRSPGDVGPADGASLAAARPGYYLLRRRSAARRGFGGLAMTDGPHRVDTICPVCLRTVPADRMVAGDSVVLEGRCPEHGAWRSPVWSGEPGFDRWLSQGSTEPLDHTCTAVLEVTRRCNLACPVCFADSSAARPAP